MSGEALGRHGAQAFREKHGLGSQPLLDLITVVEQKCECDITVLDGSDEAHGMTVRHGGTTIIGVARSRNPMRQRSTIAHELGHIWFDDLRDATARTRWAERSPEEVRADAFARHLLLPLEAVESHARSREVDERLLSDLVQTHRVSAAIAAIQLREAGLIDERTCVDWTRLTTPRLATRFGWSPLYRTLQVESDTKSPPQRLLTRAISAYAEGVVSAATIARLNGSTDVQGVRQELADEGIEPRAPETIQVAIRPRAGAGGLSSIELDELLGTVTNDE